MASNVAIGEVLIITVAADNLSSTTPTVSTISKAGGETASWVQLASHTSDSSTAAAACVGEMWGIVTTQQWNSGTVITVTMSGSITAKCTSLREFSGVTTTLRGTAASGTSSGGTPTATTSGTAPASGDLVLGFASVEQNSAITADSDTTNGSWDAGLGTHTTGGGPSSNMSTIQQYKIVTAGGNQTYNPTGGSDSGCGVVALVPAAVTVSGDGALSSGSSLTAPADVTDVSDAALSSGSTLTTTAIRQVDAVAALTSGSTLTPTALVTEVASAALTSGSTLTVTTLVTDVSDAALSSGSTLATTAVVTEVAAAALSSGSTLTSTAIRQVDAVAALTSGSTLTSTAVRQVNAAAALASGSTLTTTALVTEVASAALTSGSTLTPTALVTEVSGASLSSGSTLMAAGALAFFGVATLSSGSTMTASGTLYRTARLIPDANLVETNLTGAVTLIQDDPDAPDANWLTGSGPITLRVSFTDPPGTLRTGVGLQEFRILVRP